MNPAVRHLALSLLLAWAAAPSPARAQFTLLEGENGSLELGGYLRSLSAIHDAGYRLPGADRTSGFNGEVLRLKWVLRLGNNALVEVHDRFQIQISSAPSQGGSTAGFGVSVLPGRSLDLSTDFISEDRIRAWHDVDRLSLTLYTGLGDLTAGRQAITWGISSLFPVSDLWTQFSPFELDTEEKPGVDAFRLLSYPLAGLELDMVVADRGEAEDLSAGARASLSLSWADLFLAGGKLWNEVLVMGGISAPVGSWKLRAEGVFPYDLDEESSKLPRLTLGVDLMGGETMLSGEYHFNGIGTTDADAYGEVLEDVRFRRGESYFLGRHYLGAVGSWTPGNDRLALTLSGMANLQDGSSMVTPVLTYDLGQETRISFGALVSSGGVPVGMPAPGGGSGTRIRSEYGLYGDMVFTRMSLYF